MNGHPIDPFLAAWASAGGADGHDLRLRVYTALGFGGRWDRARLKLTLKSLLALHDRDRDLFEIEFDRFFPPPDLPPWLGGDPPFDAKRALDEIVGAARTGPDGMNAPPSLRGRPTRSIALAAGDAPAPQRAEKDEPPPPRSMLARVVLIVVFLALTTLRPSVVDRETLGPTPGNGGAPAGPAESLPGAPAVTPQAAPPPPPLFPGPRWALLVALASFAGALAAATAAPLRARRVLRRLRPAPASARILAPDASQRDLELLAPGPPMPFDPSLLTRIAYQTALVSDPEHGVLDLRASVTASARQGGFFQEVRRPRSRTATLCVVLPRDLDPVATTAIDGFVSSLRAAGVRVTLARDAPTSGEAPDVVLCVVDGSQPLDPVVPQWLAHPRAALVEARDPALWGPELERLPQGAFALDPAGLLAALLSASSGERPPPVHAPPRAQGFAALGDALPLAAACALAEPCSLATVDALRRELPHLLARARSKRGPSRMQRSLAPVLPFSAIQRVLHLEGAFADVTGLRFSPDCKSWLADRVGDGFRLAVLEWQRDRLERSTAAAGSRAEAIRDREIALVRLQELALASRAGTRVADADLAPVVEKLEAQQQSASLAARLRPRLAEAARDLPETITASPTLRWQLGRLRALPETAPPGLPKKEMLFLAGAGLLSLAGFGGAGYGTYRARQCPAGQTKCDGRCVEVGSDAHNCGACGKECTGGLKCVDGWCDCAVRCEGWCTNVDDDPQHCGKCEKRCPDDQICLFGLCKCPASSPTYCDGGCTDTSTDWNNCGRCAQHCLAHEICAGGACKPDFPEPSCSDPRLTICSDRCVDVAMDPRNCGTCGLVCAGNPSLTGLCVSGRCENCPPGYLNCDGSPRNKCEVSSADDIHNCGGCKIVCSTTAPHTVARCATGQCSYPCESSYGNCDGNPDNGCETNLLADPDNCGRCTARCLGGVGTLRKGACSGGTCTLGATSVSTCDLCEPQRLACENACPTDPQGSRGCLADCNLKRDICKVLCKTQ